MIAQGDNDIDWSLEIKPQESLFNFPWREIWIYRDLLGMFVKRDVVTVYKQTILGPVWFFIQPILTTLVYLVIFGNIAQLSTDGLPKILFYLSGVIIWNYFADCFNQTANTFRANAHIFGKVYFPRLIIPISKIASALIKFGIQLLLLVVVYAYFSIFRDFPIQVNPYMLLLPFLVLLMAGYGIAFGLIFTSLTTKYRDLTFLISFGVQLLMYATPVIYPLSSVPEEYRQALLINPISSIVEGFRFAILGTGSFNWSNIVYSSIVLLGSLFVGLIIFNRTEKNFIDTV